MENNKRKAIIGPVRLSYANIWEPRPNQSGKDKYSASIIIPKSEAKMIAEVEAAIDAALQEGAGKFGGKIPKKSMLKLPLRDGDEERDDEAYADSFFINANSNTPPQVVDMAVKPILDRADVYSGCWVNVSLTFYAFNVEGNRGIACGLGNIQKVRDDDALGGAAAKASDEFTAITEEEDDFLS